MDESQAHARKRSLKLFRLESDDEPVKFVNRSGLEYIKRNGNMVSGYFTLAKWLYGAEPTDIEQRLGLRNGEFDGVAFALVFERLPKFEEFSYQLTAAYPEGKHRPRKSDAESIQNEKATGEKTFSRSTTPVGKFYPRGDGVIHQWQLLCPLRASGFVRTVTPTMKFTRRDGSIEKTEPELGRLKGIDWL